MRRTTNLLILYNELTPFAADTPRKLYVLRRDRHAFCVDCTQVRILEEMDDVCLACFLQRHQGLRGEPHIRHVVLCDFSTEALKRQLATQQLGGLLVPPDLTQSDGARTVPVCLLHTPRRGGAGASSLRGERPPWGATLSHVCSWRFPRSTAFVDFVVRPSRSLLGTCHLWTLV